MIAPTIETWLRKKAYEEAGINLVAAVGSFVLGLVLLAGVSGMAYLFATLFYHLLVTSEGGLGSNLVAWLGFDGLWAVVSGGMLTALFAGNYRVTRRYWRQVHARRPGASARATGPGPILFDTGMSDDLLFCGPRLIVAGTAFFKRAWHWMKMDFSGCARVLARIVELNSRISYEEIAEMLPKRNRGHLIAQLRDIDGIVVLRNDPPGLTITGELRAELQRLVGFRANFRANANRGSGRRRAHQGWRTNQRHYQEGFHSRRGRRASAERGGIDREQWAASRVLGVSPDADEKAIKEAYRSLMKRYHPDRVRHLPDDGRKEAEERAKSIIKAYQILVKRQASSL